MKYSKQRESIIHALSTKLNHPTAEMVYQCVRQEQPSISLGTVYRNLNLLVEQGVLRRISTPVNGDRFDIRTDAHNHLLCTCCGNVFDIEDVDFSNLDSVLFERLGFLVTEKHIMLSGICRNCRAEQELAKTTVA